MKKLLFLAIVIPAFASAQYKRSATELAKENVQEYVTGKLFRNGSYQPVSYGELTTPRENDPSIAWFIEHKFAITEMKTTGVKKDSVQKIYRLLFYFDDKMNVLKAESFFSSNL
ncbi:MAG TPA: hypothetical protein VK588_14190 [Chitinophagaceae bacterium]|nr:hypothetical protein [Chitinophagaceae bacterium]